MTERCGTGLPARIDHQDVIGGDSLDRKSLDVGAVVVVDLHIEVLARWNVSQREGVADHAQVRAKRLQATNERVAEATVQQLGCERRGGYAFQELRAFRRKAVLPHANASLNA